MTNTTRIETDSMGPIAVPTEALWGAQTQRSLQNFAISQDTVPLELIHALARIKQVAAVVNTRLGVLDQERQRHPDQHEPQ
jgi:fumarate hydratase class II